MLILDKGVQAGRNPRRVQEIRKHCQEEKIAGTKIHPQEVQHVISHR